ncbi:MAG TPA: site-specific integrase [Desulfomonilaceae bacterium]|nr:site-specific integrase [Desulfomonilaceae bacterium]
MPSTSVSLKRLKRGKGHVYQIDYRVNGRRIREVVGSDKRTAELKRATIQQDLILGKLNLPGPDRKTISLRSLTDQFLQSKKGEVRAASLQRYSNYASRLVEFFESYLPIQAGDVGLIERKHMREFIDSMQEGDDAWAKKTLNGAIKIFRTIFAFGMENKVCAENPMSKVKEFRLPETGRKDFYSDQELDKIWETIEPHWRGCLEFIVNTGLRKGEMINLTWDDVSLDPVDPRITVASSEEWETKSGKSRIVPLNSRALEIIQSVKGNHPKYVFTSATNKKMHPDEPYHALKDALTKLGLEGDVHKLRHTTGSKLAMQGVDQFAIKDLLGHSDIKTTQIYTHTSSEHLRDAVKKLVESK